MIKIYLDSDVIISSLLSATGAAYWLINKFKKTKINFYISNFSTKELKIVIKHLEIDPKRLAKLISKFKVTQITNKNIDNYKNCVTDPNDSHIIAGAKMSEVKFLITYNKKDYKIGQIKNRLDIIIYSPGELLQYLRSLKN